MVSTFLACLLLSLATFDDAPEVRSQVRDVTAETRADPAALARLEKPGKVIFSDDFESADSIAKYFDRFRKELIRVVDDAERAHTGSGCIEFRAPANDGNASGGGVSGWLGDAGHDTVFFRRWIFFPDDYDQGNLHHTGGGLSGVGSTNKWDGMGTAGQIPGGDEGFSVAFEPWRDWGRAAAPGYFTFYTYWCDMKPGKAEGQHYGNAFDPGGEHRVVPPRGKWVCLEQMIRVNTIGEDGVAKADGEMAAWIDGKLYQHLVGFRWRTAEKVKLKRFRFGIYVHQARKDNVVYYDDVVVSTGYLGTGDAAKAGAPGRRNAEERDSEKRTRERGSDRPEE